MKPQLPSEMPQPPQPVHPPHGTYEEQPPKPVKRRVKIDPANDPGGRLEQLLIANKEAHDQASEAAERESDAKSAIKAYLLDLFQTPEEVPGAIDVAGDPHGRYPAYTMTLKGGRRFDSKKFRAEAGDELYEQYEVEIQPSWELREAQQGQRRRKLCRTQGWVTGRTSRLRSCGKCVR